MLGVSDRAGSRASRDIDAPDVAFRFSYSVGTPE